MALILFSGCSKEYTHTKEDYLELRKDYVEIRISHLLKYQEMRYYKYKALECNNNLTLYEDEVNTDLFSKRLY